ncbi:MAG: DUF1583 domain-containing protein, partial [Planctomycetota bacterium]
ARRAAALSKLDAAKNKGEDKQKPGENADTQKKGEATPPAQAGKATPAGAAVAIPLQIRMSPGPVQGAPSGGTYSATITAAPVVTISPAGPAATVNDDGPSESQRTALLLGTIRSTTLRLLTGLPADVPAAFDAAEKLRPLLVASMASNGNDARRLAAEQAFAANVLLTWAALGDPEHRQAAQAEIKRIEPWGKKHQRIAGGLRPQILELSAEANAVLAAPDAPAPPAQFGPWRSAAPGSYATGPTGRPAWTILHGTAHATGPGKANLLTFRYPLTGSFRLRIVASNGSNAESYPLFQGLIHEPQPWVKKYRARDLGGTRYAGREAPWLVQGPDLRYLIDVTPERTELRVAGRHVLTDEQPPTGSPFLGLAATDGRRAWFRTVEVIGDPVIPAEVDLLAGDRFDGWFGPMGRNPEVRPGFTASAQPPGERWFAADGEAFGPPSGHRIMHHRPLFDGDRIRFEFRTVGTVATVAPSLDRIGFVLDPGGVKLRYLPVASDKQRYQEDGGLSPHQLVAAPGALGAVPLIPDAWNEATLEANAGRLTLFVNGTPVLERDLSEGVGTPHGAAHPDRLFGLVPAPGQQARVRNVVLSGDWPAKLPAAWKANLLLAP